MSNIARITGADLNRMKTLVVVDTDIEAIALRMPTDTLHRSFLEAEKVKSFADSILSVFKKVIINKGKTYVPTDKGHYVIPIEHGSLVVKRRINTTFNSVEAEQLLREKGIYEDCVKCVIDQDKVKEYHKSRVISDEEFNKIFIQGEPQYYVEVK